MRRILLWFLATISTVVLLFSYRSSTSSSMPATTASTTAAAAAPTPSGGRTSTDGNTVTGATASTRWGPVQVRITVAGGHVTAVDVIQYPDGNRKDQEINADAIPTLVQETLQAQNANIDMVSGATVTSTGYITSLQSALDKAGIS
jgi:uncharacterized protein with FMN-binding domain